LLFDEKSWSVAALAVRPSGIFGHFRSKYESVFGVAQTAGINDDTRSITIRPVLNLLNATSLQSAKALIKSRVRTNLGHFGEIEDVFIDDVAWRIRYIMIDTVKYWPSRKVLLSTEWTTAVNWNDKSVLTNVSEDKIKSSPDFDPSKPINREYEELIFAHYAQPVYWTDKEISEIKEGAKYPWRKSI